jgi:hypothetical protein
MNEEEQPSGQTSQNMFPSNLHLELEATERTKIENVKDPSAARWCSRG